jgi:hypothetical protein
MTEVRASDYFAIIPEFVLYADISANAIRLYAVLNRFANSQGKAWPSRKTIADLMRCSTATVDRAKDELVDAGALIVDTRTSPSGDFTSNLYTLITSSPVMRGICTGEETGVLTRDELNKARINQSHKSTSSSKMKRCRKCDGKNFDTTDYAGLTCLWEPNTRTFTPCDECDGTGINP